MLPVVVACEWYSRLSRAGERFTAAETIFFFAPALTVAASGVMCVAVIVLKWLMLGRTQPGQRAFWSCWCGRWDFLYMAWEKWATLPLTVLDGTLLLNAFLRLPAGGTHRQTGAARPGQILQMVDPDDDLH